MTVSKRQQRRVSTRDGVRLHVVSRRSGPDRGVVVPGAWLLASSLDMIAAQQAVFFYDMRSRGRSDAVNDPDRLGFRFDVRDLEDIRRQSGLSRMSLVGFSYLGGVVARYAMTHPNRVDRLVLLGSIPPRVPAPYSRTAPDSSQVLGPERTERLEKLRMGPGEAEDPVVHCRAYWRALLPLYTAGPEAADRLADTLDLGCSLPNERPSSFERVLGRVAADLETYDWREEAATLDVPTLVLHGSHDHVAPLAGAREWAETLPAARLKIVEQTGHLLWAERPAAVQRELADFLAIGSEDETRRTDGAKFDERRTPRGDDR